MTGKMMKTITTFIGYCRKSVPGLTLKTVAQRLGMSSANAQRWETANNPHKLPSPPMEHHDDLADMLNVPVEYIREYRKLATSIKRAAENGEAVDLGELTYEGFMKHMQDSDSSFQQIAIGRHNMNANGSISVSESAPELPRMKKRLLDTIDELGVPDEAIKAVILRWNEEYL